jgi:hypothetical protein
MLKELARKLGAPVCLRLTPVAVEPVAPWLPQDAGLNSVMGDFFWDNLALCQDERWVAGQSTCDRPWKQSGGNRC